MKRVSLVKVCLVAMISATFLFSFGLVNTSKAQEETPADGVIEEVVEVNSFELFWPIVAGKTMGDPLYFLKSLKETVRGWLIFGNPQKVEYSVFLATKRVIEAEELLNEGKLDLANKTLDKAILQFEKAEKVLDTLTEGTSLGDLTDGINIRLDNLEIFIPWLSSQSEGAGEKLGSVLAIVKELNEKI